MSSPEPITILLPLEFTTPKYNVFPAAAACKTTPIFPLVHTWQPPISTQLDNSTIVKLLSPSASVADIALPTAPRSVPPASLNTRYIVPPVSDVSIAVGQPDQRDTIAGGPDESEDVGAGL